MLKSARSALSDISAGIRMRRVWMALAQEDIGDQHRRTALGPLWLLVNFLAFAGVFSVVFRSGAGIPNFPAYVAIGLLVWLFISEVLTQATALFSREESFIKGTTLPLSVYVLRLTAQSLIRSGYALVGCIGILLVTGTPFGPSALWSILALLLIMLITPAAVTVFAMAGAFFPDIQFVVNNLVRLGMFLTPIFWTHTEGQDNLRGLFYYWNPFTYFLDIVRAPVLSGELPIHSLMLCAMIGLALWALALFLLGHYRKNVVFVL